MSEPHCWKCGRNVELPEGRVTFRAVCDHCSAWLHCCAACQHYAPGKPNDCAIPDTDPIADREACNYCDEYAMAGLPDEKHRNATDVAEGLFGEKPEGFSNKEPKDRFKDLFDD